MKGRLSMSGLYFDQFEQGQELTTPSRTITETDVVMFAALSGDYNELHTSETFGESSPFGQRLAHGLLILSVSHGLMFRLGVMDGTGMALLGVDNWNFLGPVFIGDTISCKIKVLEKIPSRSKPDRGIIKFEFTIIKQDGTEVQKGIKTLMIRREVKC